MSTETARLLALGKAVVNDQFPTWNKKKPTYLNGVAYTLTLELTAYDTTTMSDEHIRDLMEIDLGELRKSLQG